MKKAHFFQTKQSTIKQSVQLCSKKNIVAWKEGQTLEGPLKHIFGYFPDCFILTT
jgi:hypothetical protein